VAVALGSGFGSLDEGSTVLENWIAKEEREPMPARFPGSVHNAPAAQVAIDLGARGLNSAPTAADISFEGALWQGMCQLAGDEADCALVGAVDELNKYPLGLGTRWGFWTEQTRPGEGAVVAKIVRGESEGLAHVTRLKLGRYHRPFDAAREAAWIANNVQLQGVHAMFTGAKGWSSLDENYRAVAELISELAGHEVEHRTYKQLCGEFASASAFGFAQAVEWVRERQRGALLYTLSPRGGKALCCIEP
jgi:hypothetical protein